MPANNVVIITFPGLPQTHEWLNSNWPQGRWWECLFHSRIWLVGCGKHFRVEHSKTCIIIGLSDSSVLGYSNSPYSEGEWYTIPCYGFISLNRCRRGCSLIPQHVGQKIILVGWGVGAILAKSSYYHDLQITLSLSGQELSDISPGTD